VPAGVYFIRSVAAVVEAGLAKLGLSEEEKRAYHGFRFRPPASPDLPPEAYRAPSITDLKAGPLVGIWATGPFLHNGSVPNVFELLSPVEARSKAFWVGSNDLDTQRLGFASVEKPGLFRFDTSLPGNSNAGHSYPPTPYTDEERRAVIEYLKDPEAEGKGRQ